MKDIRQQLLAIFQVEHKEHLQCIRDILERTGGNLAGTDLDEAFRRAHSLKGAARAVDLQPIEMLAHRIETMFSRVRSNALKFDERVAKVVRLGLDTSEDLLADLSQNRQPTASTHALAAIEQLLADQPAATADSVQEASPQPPQPAPAQQAAPVFQPIETVRLLAKNLDDLVNSAGLLSTENLRQDLLAERLRELEKRLKETLSEQGRMRKSATGALRSEYLENRMREMSEEVRQLRHLHDRNSWALRSLTTELQTEVRQARMVPADNVFEGFSKLVRDLARDEDKTVELQVLGAAVQADRVVLQALKDPLMHVLRNALSHGIEPDRERKQKGKSADSVIRLKIHAQGNRLNVAVEDNGRGLNLAKIAEVGIRQGLITEADARTLSKEDLARLVFLPGFSTSKAVTAVSGRGMGLSVVAEAVSRLQGKAEIEPLIEGGTRITISVPLTISSHRLLLVSCREQTFAIPLHGIERLHRLPLSAMETVEGRAAARVEGRLIPLIGLAEIVGIADTTVSVDREMLSVAVIRLGENRLAIAVDNFLSEREAVIKDLPPAVVNPKLAGGILLEDGSVCLVLNPAEMIGAVRQTARSLVVREAPLPQSERSSRILVVDDSLTTRTLEKSILEAHGYGVAVAVDGVEALDFMRGNSVGLVITDVEMPRLDGFGLIAEMKRDDRLSRIPVIVVTSLESREQRERGLSLGADAYIVKKRFEQRELLETIRQIL